MVVVGDFVVTATGSVLVVVGDFVVAAAGGAGDAGGAGGAGGALVVVKMGGAPVVEVLCTHAGDVVSAAAAPWPHVSSFQETAVI